MTQREMTIAEAAEKFGIKHRTLWAACKAGRVKARRSGTTWLIENHDMAVAIISRLVKVDKALVDAMVLEYQNGE